MDTTTTNFVRADSLEELKAKGRLVAHGRHRPILVVPTKRFNGCLFPAGNEIVQRYKSRRN